MKNNKQKAKEQTLHDRKKLINQVLDLWCNSPELTLGQFLSSYYNSDISPSWNSCSDKAFLLNLIKFSDGMKEMEKMCSDDSYEPESTEF